MDPDNDNQVSWQFAVVDKGYGQTAYFDDAIFDVDAFD